MELQAKVASLDRDIQFLKCLYDAVRTLLALPVPPPSTGGLPLPLPGRCQSEGLRIRKRQVVLMERCKASSWETRECRLLVPAGYTEEMIPSEPGK